MPTDGTEDESFFGRPPPRGWDTWIASRGAHSGYCQTTSRAEVVNSQRGARSYVVTHPEGGRGGDWKAGALLTRFQPRVAATGGSLSCFQGPVLSEGASSSDLAALLDRIEALGRELGIGSINFPNPPVHAPWTNDIAFAVPFEARDYRAKPWATFIVDLTREEDDLFASAKHAARKGVRKCRKNGITVSLCRNSEEFVNDFYASYYESEIDEGGDRLRRARDWWSIDGGRHYRFFTAKDAKGRVLATLGTYCFGRIATEIMSSRTKLGQDCGLPAQDLLHWEIFCAHKAAGDEAFNLAGVNPSPKDRGEEGIYRFKEKWGGRRIDYKMYSKRFEPDAGLRKRIHRTARAVWHALRGRK